MGEGQEDDGGPFLPMRLFRLERGDDRSTRPERARERQIAARVSKAKERGGRRPGGRTRGLSRADIVQAAVAVADAEGSGAVSMRRIAKDLQVGVMSLYWHIESKEDLHQLMLETVQGEITAAAPSGDWRADLTEYARNTRAAIHRHPWAIDYVGVGPPSGPNDARNIDHIIAAFDGVGLDVMSTVWALMAVGTYVMGAALREIQEIRWHRAAEETVSEEEADEAFAEFERQVHASGRYPHLAKLLEEDIDPDAPETRDERFEFGLTCVLDGIAVRIKERAQPLTAVTLSSGSGRTGGRSSSSPSPPGGRAA